MHTATDESAPAQMTDEQAVKAVHERAQCVEIAVGGRLFAVIAPVSSDHWRMKQISDSCSTKAEAWANARRRLASAGAETEVTDEKCESCDSIATTVDDDGVPLCQPCADALERYDDEGNVIAPQQSPAQEQDAVTDGPLASIFMRLLSASEGTTWETEWSTPSKCPLPPQELFESAVHNLYAQAQELKNCPVHARVRDQYVGLLEKMGRELPEIIKDQEQQIATLRAELDEAQNRAKESELDRRKWQGKCARQTHYQRVQDDSLQFASKRVQEADAAKKIAEARCDAYKAALEDIRNGVGSSVSEFCGCDHATDDCCAKQGVYCPQCMADAALSPNSTANSPASADSSRDGAGAGMEAASNIQQARQALADSCCIIIGLLKPKTPRENAQEAAEQVETNRELIRRLARAAAPASGKDGKQ